MSEEEKKAIEILHNWLCDEHSKFCRVGAVGIPNKEFFATEIVLNLVKNLIAGNKELKEENGRLRDKIKELEKEKENEFQRGFLTKVAENKANTLKIESQVILKSLVREKMDNDIKTNEHTILGGRRNGKTLEYGIRLGRIQMCEELLEGSEK